MKKKLMLINAVHPEQSRVSIIDDQYLQELDIESAHKVQTKSNIYKGTVSKVEASLQAAFVEYGAGRQGFLPLHDIHQDYWKEGSDKTADARKINIQDILAPKQSVLVQVVKEERGNKGAALTTYISLAGRYLVLSPNTSRVGISRKLKEEDRRAIKAILAELDVPEDMGLIVRTAGKDQKLEALQRDFSYLQRLWDEIRIKSENAPSPSLIYLEGDLATRAIRDHFTDDIQEIWVDQHDVYQRTKLFVHAVLPGKEKLVKLYRGKKPLFRHYGIEDQCEEIHDRSIRLPSGGSIVFDPTEALTSIDVNSSRSTGKKHIDDTALDTNMEAAREIARQLRIRDIGGLIVIDFIDMSSRKHGQQVEEELRDCCKPDKARVQFARISRFGLLEMSRQRLRPSIRESTTETCPRCMGRGRVRIVESMALQMLTRMEDHAEAGKKPTLLVQVPKETGEYLMNNKRQYIARIEENYAIQINLQIRPDIEIPHYRIERHWMDESQQRIEVLEDTLKGKKPARTGRKLKPTTPIVGIPTTEDKEETKTTDKKKRSLLNKLGDVLFGGVTRRKQQEEEERREKEEKKEEAARNAQRRGTQRRRGVRGGRRPKATTSGQDQKQNKGTEASPTPERQEQNAAVTSPQETRGNDSNGGVRRRRRRRRPPRKPAEQNQQQTQLRSADSGGDQKQTRPQNTDNGDSPKPASGSPSDV